MIINILIILIFLVGLITIHELGHFLVAKKFGVAVEEFGIGYPPRIFGKRIGETLYSFNLLPFGAFVKIKGEEESIEDPRSFSKKPIWQRALILIGGVLSTWVVAVLILSFIAFYWGIPTAIPDNLTINQESSVAILYVEEGSPANEAGIKAGDKIVDFGRVEDFQNFIEDHLGEKILLSLKRGSDILDVKLIPRLVHEEDQGAVGVGLTRVANIKYPWYQAPFQGLTIAAQKTIEFPVVLANAGLKAIQGEKVEGVQLVGPVGVGKIMTNALEEGLFNFLIFFSMIAVWLSFVNILPIPALDGGKLLFLGIERVRGKPINRDIEQKVNLTFFGLLIVLMIFVTIKDIINLF
jgi:regulator of sigma E protease